MTDADRLAVALANLPAEDRESIVTRARELVRQRERESLQHEPDRIVEAMAPHKRKYFSNR